MVMNYDRVLEQAKEYGHSPARECGYLAIHSALHLLGYDHEGADDDRKLMRAREDAALEALHLTRGSV
jgi:probable rRNA maturation factor